MRFVLASGVIVSFLLSAGCARHTDHTMNQPQLSTHRVALKSTPQAAPSPTPQLFDQTLDHFTASDTRTFKQRYLIDSEYATGASSPVIYYVCGEGNCMTGELDPSGWANQLAKKMSAHFVALEHRYYGQSQPFDTMTADTFKYLNVEQALQDLVTFQKWVMSTQHLTGKWVTIGGSYPASLSAVYRLEHPDLASGAIASSACARLDKDSFGSDQTAAKDLSPECVAKYRTDILMPIVMAVGNTQAMAPFKATFDAADIADDLDFLGTMTGMSVALVQYGGAKNFCNSLDAADPVTSYAKTLNQFVLAFGGGAPSRLINWSYSGNLDTKSSLYEGGFGFRQWIYQACTQEGLYTAAVMKANPDTTQSLSSSLTDPLPEKYCGVYFGIQTPPDIDGMNQKYYYPLLDPAKASNILFISGNNDPACFPDAIAVENQNATNPNTVAYTVDGGTHCQDLDPPTSQDSASLQKARALELELATKWTQ
jgi:pimeloyl-ACP methyl ester carboxylesterase